MIHTELQALQRRLTGKVDGMTLVDKELDPSLLLEHNDRSADVSYLDGRFWIELSDDLEDEETMPPSEQEADTAEEAEEIVLDWFKG